MQLVELPNYEPKIIKKENQLWIFDKVRKKYLLLKPEEWVRQQFIHFLTEVLHYPKSCISIEKELSYGKRKKRVDILLYDKNTSALILVECKAPQVKINTQVLEQAITYNYILKSPWIALTNGSEGAFLNLNENQVYELKNELPSYEKI